MKKEKAWAIWWVNQKTYEAMPELPEEAPEYLKEQYRDRQGRVGRCRLWVDERFKDVSISPWPDTPFARWLELEDFGGIAVSDDTFEFNRLADLPGILTSLYLERVI